MHVILHTTNCPKCKILETKLNMKNIAFQKNEDIDVELLREKGFMSAPVLQVGDEYLDFTHANKWISEI